MKLLLCKRCDDVVKFGPWPAWRSCQCGESAGRYRADGHYAEKRGPCVALGVSNPSLLRAVRRAAISVTADRNFDAWVFTRDYERIVEVLP